jgi:putative hydrolase of the HAD superfamily
MAPPGGLASSGRAGHIARMSENEMPRDSRARKVDLSEVETWIFDLDNTLYHVSPEMHGEVDELLGSFVSEFLDVDRTEARRIQKAYFQEFGLTLCGLIENHDLDPDVYFEHMMQADLSAIGRDPALVDAISALDGRKVIYSNAPSAHVNQVLDQLGLAPYFDAVHHIEAAEFRPKPAREAYVSLCERYAIAPERAVMIDDIPRNLEPAAEIGMTTVWKRTDAEWAVTAEISDYVHHVTDDLLTWLKDLPNAR